MVGDMRTFRVIVAAVIIAQVGCSPAGLTQQFLYGPDNLDLDREASVRAAAELDASKKVDLTFVPSFLPGGH